MEALAEQTKVNIYNITGNNSLTCGFNCAESRMNGLVWIYLNDYTQISVSFSGTAYMGLMPFTNKQLHQVNVSRVHVSDGMHTDGSFMHKPPKLLEADIDDIKKQIVSFVTDEATVRGID